MYQRRQTPPCPGLNRVSTRDYHWIVPHGSTPKQRTYCEACARQYGVQGSEYREFLSCNCDSYRLKNKADNGIVNISFWDYTLHNIYETFPINESDTDTSHTYCVKIPSGQRFSIMIQADMRQGQTFRYEVDYTNSGSSDVYKLSEESKVFVHESVFIGNEDSKAALKPPRYNFVYIDSANPGWTLLDGPDRVSNYKVVRPGDSMVVKVHVYNSVEHNFMSDSNRDIGKYVVEEVLTIKPKTSTVQEQQCYDHAPIASLPNHEYKLYTKKPIQMRFIFLTDNSQPDASDAVLNTCLTKLLNMTDGKLKELNVQLVQLNKQESEIRQQITMIQQGIDTVKEMTAKVKSHIH